MVETDTDVSPVTKWQREAFENKAKLVEAGRAIIDAIGGTAVAVRSPNEPYWNGIDFEVDGIGFCLSTHRGNDRWSLHLRYHDGFNHCRREYDVETTSISCGFNRTPSQIAADFRRRLLPVGQRLTPLATAALEKHNNREALTKALAKKLADASGETQSRLDTSTPVIHVGGSNQNGYGDFTVHSPDCVYVTLRSVKPEIALKIVELLRQ